jgi:hypothetical protein
MLIIFFDIKGIVHKEFVLAGQTVNSAYNCDVFGDCVKMCKDFTPDYGDKITGCCVTTAHRLTIPLLPENFFYQKQMTVVPHSPYFSLFP